MNNKKTPGYYMGALFAGILTACLSALAIGITIKLLSWIIM